MQYPVLLILFFLSGASALIYEVLWTRLLTITFGHTVYAVSTILTVFMAGLALGSYLAGKYSFKIRRPAFFYAGIELVIGLYALALYPILLNFHYIYKALYAQLLGHFGLLVVLRVILAFGVLLFPCTLMGATIAILSRAVTAHVSQAGKRIGGLYAVNTLGAVGGTVGTGYLLIPLFGHWWTNIIAICANVLIFLMALAFSLHKQQVSLPNNEESLPQNGSPGILYFLMALSGFIALAYEVLWFRALVFYLYLGSTTYAFSTMLSMFLIGIALGSYIASQFVGRLKEPASIIAYLLLGEAVFSLVLLSVVLKGGIGVTTTADFQMGALRDFLKSAMVMLPSTLLMGMIFPLVVRLAIKSVKNVAVDVGRLYAANTVGAICGSFCGGFILLPLFGITLSNLILGIIALGTSIFFLQGYYHRIFNYPRYLVMVVLALLIIGFSWQNRGLKGWFEEKFDICFQKEGAASTITVVEANKGIKLLFVDNVFVQGSNNVLSLTDIKSQAHLPSLFHPNPKNACTIGYGTGGTSYSYKLHDNLKSIDCIEIDLNVLQGSDCFLDSNHGHLSDGDPRYRIINDDARAYLLNTENSYDIITIDLADIAYKSNSDVYTLEFLQQCRERLNPGGILLVWFGIPSISEKNMMTLINTCYKAFGNFTLWHMSNFPNTDLFIICRKGGSLEIDLDIMKQRLHKARIKQDLATINLDDPYKILAGYIMSEKELQGYLDIQELNTTDRPILEFEGARDQFRKHPRWENIEIIYHYMKNDLPPFKSKNQRKDEEILRTYYQSRAFYLQAELQSLKTGKLQQSYFQYKAALELVPTDRSLLYCMGVAPLQIAEYERQLKLQPDNRNIAQNLAVAYFETGRGDAAEKLFTDLLDKGFVNADIYYYLALIQEQRKNRQKALHFYDKALSLLPAESPGVIGARKRITEKFWQPSLTELSDKQLIQLAQLYVQSRQILKAPPVMKEFVRRRPNDLNARKRYALLLREANLPAQAIQQLMKATKIAPNDAESWYYLADIALQIRDKDKALRFLDKAKQLDPKNPNISYNFLRYYAMENQFQTMKDYYSKLGNRKTYIDSLIVADPFMRRFNSLLLSKRKP